MKKLLLTFLMLIASVPLWAQSMVDDWKYPTQDGLICKNKWIIDRNHNKDKFLNLPFIAEGATNARTAVIDPVRFKIYVGYRKDSNAHLIIFNLSTGAYEKELKLTCDGQGIGGFLPANQVGVDDAGNVWFCGATSTQGDAVKIYVVDNFETGECKNVGEWSLSEFEEYSAICRFDHRTVVGDITGKTSNAVCMAAASMSGSEYSYVYRWELAQGATEWKANNDAFAGAIAKELPESRNIQQSGIVEILPEEGHKASKFYIDGLYTYPTLYNMSLEIEESFDLVPDLAPNTKCNGIKEFTLNDEKYIAYAESDHSVAPGSRIKICKLGENGSFIGMKHLWNVPETGLGETSDGGIRVHSIDTYKVVDNNGKEGVYLFTYKCNNGIGLYLIAEEGFDDQFPDMSAEPENPENPEEPGDEENIGSQFTKDGLTYEVISSNEVKIIGNDGSLSGVVKIPASVDFDSESYTVTEISAGAFKGCTDITEVIIPESITSIGDGAFNNTSISKITLLGSTPPEVNGDFIDSKDVQIVVPEGSLDLYKQHSYWGQFSNISDGTMQPEKPEEPGDEENIGSQFTEDGLTYEVISSNEVKIIGNDGSISGTIVVPSSVDDEDGNVYSVTMIGKDSFAYCPSLAILDIHENIKGFEDGYLNGNEQNLVIIMRSTNPPAFADPYGGFYKGSWVLRIPMDAYSQYQERGWTDELQVIDINDPLPEGWEPVVPNDNNGILYEIIEGTKNVRVTGFEDNGDSNYRELTIQSSVIIEGENYAVTEIGDNATLPFGVTNVTLPETITYIGENFVSGSTGALNKITLGAKNPPMISGNIVGSFDIYYEGLWIVVPDDCVEAYKNNEYWSNFKRIVNQNDLPKYTITTSYENGKGVVTGYEGDLSGKLILPIYMSIAGYPQSITCINSDVFADCVNITSVEIPNTYNFIGTNAFKGCTGLTEVNITDLSAWCNISFESNQSGPVRACYDNPLYYAHKLTLNGEEVVDLVIPDGVTRINRCSFINCTNIKSVTIPKSVNQIEGHAFNGCINLTDVNISNLSAWCNTYCESYYSGIILSHPLFSNPNAKLKLNGEEIVDLVIPNDVTSINIGAFSCISSLKSVVISDSVTKVAEYAFGNCSNLSDLTIGSSVASLGMDSFNGCNSIEVINAKSTIPPTISYYFYDDFHGSFTDYSATVNVPMGCRDVYKQTEGWCNFSNIQGPGFTENGIKYEYISDTEVTIYSVDPSLSGEFIIPETANENLYKVVAISDSAFANCSAITSITIPESLTSIGSGVFEGCTALENINWEAINCSYSGITAILPSTVKQVIFGDKVETITNYLCADLTSIESFIIPKSVNVIGVGAFANCYSMQTIEIPEKVISIGDGAFHNTSIVNVEWNAVNLYNNGMSFLPSSVRNINFGNDVVYIPMYACQGLTNLTSVVIPDAVEKIDVYAFEGCTSLSEVKIGKSVTDIMYLAFGNCTALENIIIPDATTNIDYAAFSGCSNLKNVTIGSGMQNIGEYAFDGCLRIEKVTVKATTAPTIANANAFTSDTYRFAELYVKYGYKSIYEKELFWRNFETISEESSPNHFEVAQSGMKASRGGKFSIPLNLINDNEIAGFQADIYLPSGFNVITTNDEYDITLSGRASASHSISYNVMSDGALRIIAYSTEAKAFEGNEGTLVNINIKIADNFNGSSKVEIKNVQMTSPDNTEYGSSDVEFSVTVQDPVLGNANGEAGVNVSDVIATANYVMGNSSTPVDLTNADINMDGEVNVVDVVGISNIVIGSTPNAMDVVSAKNKEYQSMLPYSLSANNFFIENFEIYPGEEKVVEVVLNNNVAFTAFQADMYLPAGLNIKGDIELTSRKANHSLISSKQADGSTRILSYSATSRNFSGNDEAILTFKVVADESFKGDVLKIKDVIFSQQDMTSYKLNNTETKVWIAGVDGVMSDESVDVIIINGEIFVKGAEDAQIAVYNVNGGLIYHGLNRPVAVANKGVYVVVVNGIAMKVTL